ncbi:MAG: methyl-accepting chemotaxis protein [Desulfovibrio sp.]|uniref:methyl-accepting chemotaxis protein n=1 Tax=Desulfovibrio sp. TaxID=885 RepID=UPI0025BA6579|nr:methyl-accepting chemotaxis protein [Desulfovibrio sp.]MCI7567879.1 methyl-accepting chemotaxis protein [Desulfovibrio sp.]
MKLTLQKKLLLPILGALIILMTCSTMTVISIVTNQLEDAFQQELEATSITLLRNVRTAATSYKTSVNAIASTARLRALADVLGGQGGNREEALQLAQDTLENFGKVYTHFESINFTDGQGLVIASSDPSSIGKVNVGKRRYFQDAMQGDTSISAPFVSMASQNTVMSVITPMRDSAGKIVGTIYTTVPCSDVVANTIAGISIGHTGFAYIVDDSGLMIAHPDAGLIRKFDAKTTDWGRQILAKPEGALRYVTSKGVERQLNFRRDDESGWIAVTCIDLSEVDDATGYIRNVSMAVMLAGAVLVALLIWLIVRPIIRDLLKGVAFAKAVSEGNLDQTGSIQRNDELGELFDALAVMLQQLKNMIASARQKEAQANEESRKAQEAMRQAEEAGREAREKTAAMLRAADKLAQVGSAVSSASAQLSAQIEQSDKGAAESAQQLTEAATAMNQMNATVQEVAKNSSTASAASTETRQKAESGAKIVERSLQRIQSVHATSLRLKEDMGQLNEHTQAITQIMNVISDIADQTNLLALNAAIEAARAGEAGRGFAVVADEVRKLAEKTMASTQDVGNAIKAIQDSAAKSTASVDDAVSQIEEATGLANQSGTALQEIVSMVESTADQINAIATASEEQSAASEQINHSIFQVSDMSKQTADAMAEAAKAVAELAAQAETLAGLIQDLKQA